MVELALGDFAGHAFEGADVDDPVDFAILVGMKRGADREDFLADEVFAQVDGCRVEDVADFVALWPFEGVCHGAVHREHHVSDEMRDDDVERCVCRLKDILVDDVGVFDPLAEMREFDADATGFELSDHETVGERVMPDIDLAGEAD